MNYVGGQRKKIHFLRGDILELFQDLFQDLISGIKLCRFLEPLLYNCPKCIFIVVQVLDDYTIILQYAL